MSFNNDHRSVSELLPQEREELSDTALAGEVIEDIEGAGTHSEFDGNAINLYDRFIKESDSPREIEFHEDYLVYVAADMAPSLFDAAYPDKILDGLEKAIHSKPLLSAD